MIFLRFPIITTANGFIRLCWNMKRNVLGSVKVLSLYAKRDKIHIFTTVGFDKEIQVWYTKTKYDYIKFKLYVIFMYRCVLRGNEAARMCAGGR